VVSSSFAEKEAKKVRAAKAEEEKLEKSPSVKEQKP
jgi:DnaJ homolog subfamily C member 2